MSFNGTAVALTQTFGYTTDFSAPAGSLYKTTNVTARMRSRAPRPSPICVHSFSVPVGPDDGLNLEGVVPSESSITYKDGNQNTYGVVNKAWSDQTLMTCESNTHDGITSRIDYSPGAGGHGRIKASGIGAPACGGNTSGNPLRQTQVSTQSFPVQVYPASYFSPYSVPYFSRPTTVTTNYNGAQAAKTTYVYDESSLSSGGTTVGRDSNYNSGGTITARGNAPSNPSGLTPPGGHSPGVTVTTTPYKLTMSDPKSNPTQYSYADAFQACGSAPGNTNAYLTKITNAKGFTQSFTYRYCDGQLNSSTDRNTQPTAIPTRTCSAPDRDFLPRHRLQHLWIRKMLRNPLNHQHLDKWQLILHQTATLDGVPRH